ncbi:hypothetical protein Cocul_01056 [Corynebacterium oculi]|uniref:Uncharacterized protein n=1 Tax=Corynebacterium oculi TaxID=1544416 RepID=A0A0Q0YD87_9CORY|nr:hypothetical protein Cocul_01056 [Corynebacterium oculi]
MAHYPRGIYPCLLGTPIIIICCFLSLLTKTGFSQRVTYRRHRGHRRAISRRFRREFNFHPNLGLAPVPLYYGLSLFHGCG